MKTVRPLFFALLMLAMPGLANPCAAATLRGDTEVNRPIVKLSDVFDGLPAGIDCDIARAPTPGKSIVYNVNVLQHLAQQYSLDWKSQSAGDHITITTIGTEITADDIRPYIVQKMKDLDVQGDIDVMLDGRALNIMVPSDKSPEISLNNFNYEAINKRFHAELLVEGFAGPVDLPLAGHIVVRHNVPVLVRRLEAGSIISATDIDWLSVPEDRTAGTVSSAEQLINHELQHDTDAGLPIREHDVIPPRLVTRGSLVTMKIETAFMVVTAQGRALQDGKRGDTVRVTNTQSNRMIEGVVESAGVVRVPIVEKVALAAPPDGQE